MKRYLSVLAAMLLIYTDVSATTCRSQTAAVAGSRSGYDRDKVAATQVEQKESQSSDVVGRCVSGITAISVVPTFPSLSDIFNAVVERACTVAIDRIRDVSVSVASGIPAVGDTPGSPSLPSWPSLSGMPGSSGSPASPASTPLSTAPATTAPATITDLWRAIWR